MHKKSILFNIDTEFDQSIKEASKLFIENKIFIYPTDTLYGIGGNIFNHSVGMRINKIKGREDFKQFILLINDVKNLDNYVEVSSGRYEKFLKTIWPGPVTVVFKSGSKIIKEIGSETIAFRIPDNKFCLELLNEVKKPLISTSVNKKNEIPMTDFRQIKSKFTEFVDAIFYTEKKYDVIPSTIIDLTGNEPKLIREGKIKFVELLAKFS